MGARRIVLKGTSGAGTTIGNALARRIMLAEETLRALNDPAHGSEI
jgi:hypothetical protein